jgi:acetoin utilization protein AcuB
MTRRVVVLHPKNSVTTAYETMQEFAVRHIPVCHDGVLVGMVSDRDVLRLGKLLPNGQFEAPEIYLDSVATKDLITCRFYDLVTDVARKMVENRINAVPVVNDRSELEGLITSMDLLQYLANYHREDPVQDLPLQFEIEPFRMRASSL